MAGQDAGGASEPIIYIDHSDIHEGSLDELKAVVKRIVDFIDTGNRGSSRTGSTSTKT